MRMTRMPRLGALSLGLLLGSTVAGGFLGQSAMAGTGGRLNDDLRLYTSILSAVQDEYVDEVPSERLVAASVRELLRSLDPHSNFLETRDYASLQERQKGSYSGLGIQVQSIEGNITVIAPFEATPAHRLGIRAGDVISAIEGEDARGMNIDDAVKRLRGPKGTSVRIAVVRQGYETPLQFTVLRDEIPLHSVPYFFMVAQKTGYVRLTDFNETTACRVGEPIDCQNELEHALQALQREGATSILLDLRDNPGGLLDQAIAVSNLFLKKGQLVVFTRGRNRRDEANYITERESPYVDMPLVALVSRHSASASEIVAGALQDHDRAVIVGETTFGKGLVQTVMPLRNVRGYALSLTTARYYTPSGRSIQRDYGSTALEDYYAGPKDRPTCAQGPGEAKLTDAGRRVLGGDGIAPDYCVEPDKPSKFLSYLIGRQAFVGFSRGYASADSSSRTDVAGAGSRPDVTSGKVKLIGRDFDVSDAVLVDFKTFLKDHQLRFSDEDLQQNREPLAHLILEEVLRQVFGEGESKRRTLKWDPQFRRALEATPSAERLLRDPQGFIAVRAAEGRQAAPPNNP
jgi:carboxyl-terminal processing protease